MDTLLEEGRPVGDLKRLEKELFAVEQLNTAFLNALPDMVFLIRKDGTYLDYHAKTMSDLLVPPDRFLGRNLREIMPREIAEQIFILFKAAKKTGETQCFEYSLDMNGVENTFECRIVQSGADKFLSVVRNVTDQRLFRKALAESEKRFEAQYRNNPVPTYIWSKTGDDYVLVDYNFAANAARKGKGESLLGARASDQYADYPIIFEGFNQCYNTKKRVEMELPYFPTAGSEERYIFLTYVFILPNMVMLHEQDLTQQKRAVQELQLRIQELQDAQDEIAAKNKEITAQYNQLKSSRAAHERERKRYLELFDSAPDGYLITDRHGKILEANRAAAVMLEMDQKSLGDLPITSFVVRGDRKAFSALMAVLYVREAVKEIEITLLRGRREEFQAAVTVSHAISEGEDNLRWIIRDITEKKRARRELQESEEFNRRIIESSNDCIEILDLEGKILYLNSKGQELLEIVDKSCVGEQFLSFWDKSDIESLKQGLEKAKTGGVGRLLAKSTTARGKIKWWDILMTPISNAEGKTERLLIVKRDITEQKLASEKLLQKEKFFRSLIENAHDVITVLRYDGTIVYESPASERLLGYRIEDRIGVNCFDFIHPDDISTARKAFSEVVTEDNDARPIEYRYRHKNGSWLNLEVIGRSSRDENGEPIVIVNKRDITERKIFEEKLRTSEELYRTVVEAQTELICRYLPDTTLTFVNEAYCRFFGKSRDELIGTKFVELIPENNRQSTIDFMNRLIETGKSQWMEHEVVQADGTVGWQQWIDHVIRDEQGNILELQGIGRDITLQKHATERLRESEERFNSFMSNSPVAAWIDDEDGQVLYVNSTYRKTIKLPAGEIIGKSLYDVFSDDAARRYHSVIKTALSPGSPGFFINEIVRADDSTGTFLSYYFPLTSTKDGKRLVGGFAIDITEQQRIEKALSESEERYRRIVDTMLEGIWVTNNEMNIVFANQQLSKMLGYKMEEMLGQPVFDFYDEETRSRWPQISKRRRSGISEHYDAQLRCKDGSYIWVIVSATPFYDAAGGFAGAMAMVTDITERKQAENNLREQEALLRGLIEHIPDGALVVLDRNYQMLMTEGKELERFGWGIGHVKGKRISEMLPKDKFDFVRPYYDRAFEGEEVWFEGEFVGQIYKSCVLPLRDQHDYIYAILVVVRNITEHRQREEQLQQLSARLLNLQDDERRRLARELHDETAQNLAGLGINLAALKKMIQPDHDKALNILRESEWLTTKSLREVRTLSYLLHPPMLDEGGLISALRWFINGFSARSGIVIDFMQHGEIGRLPSEIETALYRIVQEGLTNIHRHSGSPTARIELFKDSEQITLIVQDKGCGLPENILDKAAGNQRLLGVGIPGMRERLRLLGGNLEIYSDKNGTTLTASVPLEVNNI